MNELEGYADEMVYIPGNHDPESLFNKDRTKLPILSSNVDGNINRGIFRLREDLIVAGLGGSVQTF